MCQVAAATRIALPRRSRSNIDLERTQSKRNCKDPTTIIIITILLAIKIIRIVLT